MTSHFHRIRTFLVGATVASMGLGWAPDTHADKVDSITKAAYIRNALNFAEWPKGTFPSKSDPVILGVAGDARQIEKSFRLAFEKLGHRIQNRKVVIKGFDDPMELAAALLKDGARACQAIYLPASLETRNWIQTLGKHPVILVSDEEDFIAQGGEVSLSPKPGAEGRYLYDIHIQRLKARGLRFNSSFLRIRKAVRIVNTKDTFVSSKP